MAKPRVLVTGLSGLIGRALRKQIEERGRDVVRIDGALERLERQLRATRERAFELIRAERRPDRGLSRERSLEPGLEREHDLGIEL